MIPHGYDPLNLQKARDSLSGPRDPLKLQDAIDSLGGGPGSLAVEAQFAVRQMTKKLRKRAMESGAKYLILDFRASEEEGLDDALVLDTAETLEEAYQAAKAQNGGVIYENTGEMIEFKDMIEIVEGQKWKKKFIPAIARTKSGLSQVLQSNAESAVGTTI